MLFRQGYAITFLTKKSGKKYVIIHLESLEKENTMHKKFWISLQENKRNIKFATILFLISIIIGYVFIDQENPLIQSNLEQLKDIAEDIQNKDSISYMIMTIFKNNLFIAGLMIISGVIFGVIPMLVLISNGILIGFFMKLVMEESGRNIAFFIIAILPHGILELPAIIISAAFGMKLGFSLFTYLANKNSVNGNNKMILKHILKQIPYVFLGIAVMLLVAAIIESTLTGYLLNKIY